MTEATQAGVAMNDFNLFSDDDVAENWEEGEDGWHSGLAVNDKERNVINLEAIGEVSNSSPAFVGMRDDDYLMTSVNQLC